MRISGKNITPVINHILTFSPTKRYSHLCNFYDENHEIIDRGIAIYYPAPNSYTGEDVLELQGHGSPALINILLSTCIAAGARLAEPGEFTLRAFLNGKLDLVQAESVADIINATTSQAARCAIRSLQGDFSLVINSLVSSITELRLLIEAYLDFPEDDTEFIDYKQLTGSLNNILSELEKVQEHSRQGNLLQEGATVVLVGQPNVGKSSLMNLLSGDAAAIVTDIPGTTRDSIQRTIQVNGVPLHLIDTAGLRDTVDIIEKSGIDRTHAAIKKADVVLLIMDSRCQQDDANNMILDSLPAELPRIIVYNKIDLSQNSPSVHDDGSGSVVYLSAKTGAGVTLLRQKLLEIIGWQSNNSGEGIFVARHRHLQALIAAKENLKSARMLTTDEVSLELVAEELRLAQLALTAITGEFTADDLLGEIFSKFCIGK